MAVYNDYTVEVYDLGTTSWVEIPMIQNLRCTLGRRTSTDQWQIASAYFQARYPTGFDSPITALQVDAWIRFSFPGRAYAGWTGQVRDVRTEINLPWDGVDTGPGDILMIEAEGYGGTWGRYDRTFQDVTNLPLEGVLGIIANPFAPYTDDGPLSGNDLPDTEANEVGYNGGARDSWTWLIAASETTQARICDGVAYNSVTFDGNGTNGQPSLWVSNQSSFVAAGITFSDTTNDATHCPYFQLEYEGLADTYFTQITLTPEKTATYTLDLIESSIQRTYNINTLNTDATQAAYLASFLGAQYSDTSPGIARLVARTSGQHTQNLDTLGIANQELGYLVLNQVAIEIRGQTYLAQIEGVEVSATLGETVFTYYLSPVASVGWFTLDSATLGVLDEDRLAYT
jgi:hypothetical protein